MDYTDTTRLENLRSSVLHELVSLSEFLASDEDSSYELLLNLAKNTGNQELLEKAFQKIQRIDDPKQKSDALLDILDEVEISLSNADQQSTDTADQQA